MTELINPEVSEFERIPILSFEEYRAICDKVDRFRKVGIQSSETYQTVLQDPATIWIEIDARKIPLLAPITTEKMYDEPRSKGLIGREDVRLLAVPIDVLRSQYHEERVHLPEGIGVIVEEFGQELPEHVIPQLISAENLEIVDFKNSDLEGVEGHTNAWMASYSVVPTSEQKKRRFEGGDFTGEIVALWHEICRENDQLIEVNETSTGVFFFTDKQLAEKKEIVDGLWAVSEQGFGNVLGKGHPLSMEFSREFFDEQITSADTMTVVYFENGEPQCFSFIAPNFEMSDWLNQGSTSMKQQRKEAEENGRVPIHWYELISRGVRGMGFGEKVLGAFMELAARSGYAYQVFFESTNLSSLYIPKIVEQQIDNVDGLAFDERVAEIDRLNYWAFRT